MVSALNRQLVGWSNYFCLGPVSSAYRAVDQHTRYRLRQWLRRKHHGRSLPGVMQYPDEYLYGQLGLVRLERRTRNFPWAKAKSLSESRMRENRTSGSMSGDVETTMVGLVRHRQTKGAATDRPDLTHRATSRLYPVVCCSAGSIRHDCVALGRAPQT